MSGLEAYTFMALTRLLILDFLPLALAVPSENQDNLLQSL